ncbi:hypothetical protein H8S90_24230 [Olivibacter sp. SDN3]|uniref:M43 family zinc metalloprotease n=1 Tax=Olivibacter sp. SDN3 TaxID=2764720 RepID=UPI0016519FC5|nr:M43 family zinc metalloprotease [Olivibacter sp. SDN3]QNL49776.1 hypothetical protein H8S90_24230 [Olivibacter sp. SDN3]
MNGTTENENAQGALNIVCGTVTDIPDILLQQEALVTPLLETPAYFKFFFHIVRYSNGSGNEPASYLNSMVSSINQYYEDTDIFFLHAGYDEILSDYFANMTPNMYAELFATNVQPNVINVYLLPNDFPPGSGGWGGRADNIPGTALIMAYSNFVIGQSTFPHEVGHVLGLYHTHHALEPGGCAETPTNCTVCGDFVCDTPPDPDLSNTGYVDSWTCAYTGPSGYSPDTANIMSYSFDNCRTRFSLGQITRMKSIIDGNVPLQLMLFRIAGPDSICDTGTFSVPGITGATYTWSVGTGLTILSGQGTNSVQIQSNVLTNSASISLSVSGLSYLPAGVTISRTITTILTQDLITFEGIANKFAVPICPGQTIMVSLLYNGQSLSIGNPYGITSAQWGPAAPGLSIAPTTGTPSLVSGSSCYVTRAPEGQLIGGSVSVHLVDNCGNRTGQYITFVNC